MKFVIAPDSFKGSLSATQVSNAIEEGIKKVFPDAETIKVPLADGGEGTTRVIIEASGGNLFTEIVTGSLGSPVEAEYGILGDGKTGVLEMASASGIQHVDIKTANPLITTTFGTGELIKVLLDKGIRKIIIGLGGSATNDGGAGLASALGVKFYDENNQELSFGGGELNKLSRIDTSSIDKRLEECTFEMASDVLNPLCGLNGASRIFGSQKGATPEMIEILDANLRHYAEIVKRDIGRDVQNVPGAGAAGGLGAGMLAFTNANLISGIDLVIKYTNLTNIVKDADVVFTGEGRIDFQTKFGKAPYGVCKIVKSTNPKCAVIGVAGVLGEKIEELYEAGFDAIFPIIPALTPLNELLQNGEKNLIRTCENIVRTMNAMQRISK